MADLTQIPRELRKSWKFFFLSQMSAREEDEAQVWVQDGVTCCYGRRDWSLYVFSPSNKYARK